MDRSFLFKKLLFRLGESISRQELDSLTFMCRDVVSVARMERVQSPSNLWQALTERNKLSKNDLNYLTLLMSSIGKQNLLGELQTHGFAICDPVKSAEYLFLESLLMIAQNLTSNEFKDLTYLFEEVNPDKVFSVTQLFQMLLQRQIITPTKMQRLYDNLVVIGRPDLTEYINRYLPAPPRNTEKRATHRNESIPYQEPSLNLDALIVSTGVSSCRPEPFPISQESMSEDYPNRGHICSEELQHGRHGVAVTEREEQERNAGLLHSLSLKERELSCKQEKVEHLQRQLAEQTQLEERVGRVSKEECRAQGTKIKEINKSLDVKNHEVTTLMEELQRYKQQMGSIQTSPPVRMDDFYPLNKQPHGYCLIFNNYKRSHLHQFREGSSVDQDNLIRTFEFLQYNVVVKENLTAIMMQDAIFEFAKIDHKNFDSFVCCILAHGEADVVRGTDGQELRLQQFASSIKLCPGLREKPKIFFVQACHGDKESNGLETQKDAGNTPSGHQASPTITASIPQDTDFFFGYPTSFGSAAYLSGQCGSRYISTLCKVLREHAHTDTLSNMMKMVNNQVSLADTNRGFKQCPEFVDRLRRKVHFFLEKH